MKTKRKIEVKERERERERALSTMFSAHNASASVRTESHRFQVELRRERRKRRGGDGVVYNEGDKERRGNGDDGRVGYASKREREIWGQRMDRILIRVPHAIAAYAALCFAL